MYFVRYPIVLRLMSWHKLSFHYNLWRTCVEGISERSVGLVSGRRRHDNRIQHDDNVIPGHDNSPLNRMKRISLELKRYRTATVDQYIKPVVVVSHQIQSNRREKLCQTLETTSEEINKSYHPSARVSVKPNCGSVAILTRMPMSPLPSRLITWPRITDTRLLRVDMQ